MNMKKGLLFFLISFSILSVSVGQKTSEFGLLLGRSYYLGELNPNNHLGNDIGSFMWGGVFRFNLNQRYSLKASVLKTSLKAEDELTSFEFNQNFRKASFESKLTEFSGQIEFNFLPYETGNKDFFFSPYFFIGISAYKYAPKVALEGAATPLTETDGGTKISYPFGPGFKLSLGKKVSLAFEWGFRKTSNDFIDGIPNRFDELYEFGKNYDNDWYVISGFMLTYRLTKIGSCPVYHF